MANIKNTENWAFETKQLHIGQESPDPASDARAVPIYQTTSYVFRNSDHAAARFGLADAGNIYGRLTNSTQDVLEKRLAALEGGVAALAVASGAAAISYTLQNLAHAGDHIVAAKTIYGGTYNLLEHTLPDYGITTTFVDPDEEGSFEKAVQPNTKAIFIEVLGNPNSNLIDIDKELVRLEKEKANLEREIERVDMKLSNAEFVGKAPEKVIAAEREKQARYKDMYISIEERMSLLKS